MKGGGAKRDTGGGVRRKICMEQWGEREVPVFSLKPILVSEEDDCINSAEK